MTTGNQPGDTMVAADLGTLAASGQASVSFTVQLDDPFPAGVTAISNQGTVRERQFPGCGHRRSG